MRGGAAWLWRENGEGHKTGRSKCCRVAAMSAWGCRGEPESKKTRSACARRGVSSPLDDRGDGGELGLGMSGSCGEVSLLIAALSNDKVCNYMVVSPWVWNQGLDAGTGHGSARRAGQALLGERKLPGVPWISAPILSHLCHLE